MEVEQQAPRSARAQAHSVRPLPARLEGALDEAAVDGDNDIGPLPRHLEHRALAQPDHLGSNLGREADLAQQVHHGGVRLILRLSGRLILRLSGRLIVRRGGPLAATHHQASTPAPSEPGHVPGHVVTLLEHEVSQNACQGSVFANAAGAGRGLGGIPPAWATPPAGSEPGPLSQPGVDEPLEVLTRRVDVQLEQLGDPGDRRWRVIEQVEDPTSLRRQRRDDRGGAACGGHRPPTLANIHIANRIK